MTKTTESKWRSLIAAQGKSGLSIREFAGLRGLSIVGFATTPPIPISIAWPVGVPGCHQFVGVDLIDVLLPAGGAADAAVALPAAPVFAGLAFHHQMFPFEFDAGMNLIAVAATNALTLTAGAW